MKQMAKGLLIWTAIIGGSMGFWIFLVMSGAIFPACVFFVIFVLMLSTR